jgi:hypothetical protein
VWRVFGANDYLGEGGSRISPDMVFVFAAVPYVVWTEYVIDIVEGFLRPAARGSGWRLGIAYLPNLAVISGFAFGAFATGYWVLSIGWVGVVLALTTLMVARSWFRLVARARQFFDEFAAKTLVAMGIVMALALVVGADAWLRLPGVLGGKIDEAFAPTQLLGVLGSMCISAFCVILRPQHANAAALARWRGLVNRRLTIKHAE